MKRKIALLLALVMVLSMVPMMAFAASDNSVDRVLQVAKDAKLTTNAPKLRVEEKKAGEFNETEVFRLTLEGAKWLKEDINGVDNDGLTLEYLTEKTVIATVYKGDNTAFEDGGKVLVNVPLYTEITEEGEAKVTIEPRGSAVTGGTYVFANAAKGKTVTTVDGTITFAREKADLKTIEIDETKLGGFKETKEIKLILPRDFVWADDESGIKTKTKLTGGYTAYDKDNMSVEFSNDGEEMVIKFKDLPNTVDKNMRGSIILNDLSIEAKRNAKLGDVTLKVRGDAESQDLLVAKYTDYNVIVEADGDAKEIFAGRFETTITGSGDDAKHVMDKTSAHELQKLVIKEDVEGAWIVDRKVVIELPSWAKVTGVDVKKHDKLVKLEEKDFTMDDNVLEFIPKRTGDDGKIKLELVIYVSVEADAAGDITAKVSGRGLTDEQEVVLGKALAPVEVSVDAKDVRVGIQEQELGKITLTEVKDGGIMKGLVELSLEEGRFTEVPTVKVTEGDVRIVDKSVKINRGVLSFEVSRTSDKASVIEITDARVTLNRAVAEGGFDLSVGGSALVRNYDNFVNSSVRDYAFRTEFVAELPVARVTTPAPGETTTPEVVLTIGNTTMFVDGVATTASAAPYIDENNRTMLPVSAIGRVLGANVDWNASARTVLITKDNNKVLLTIDKDVMNVNGMEIPMRSKAVITGDRTFVPLKDLGVALGVNIEWDAATQTVTVK